MRVKIDENLPLPIAVELWFRENNLIAYQASIVLRVIPASFDDFSGISDVHQYQADRGEVDGGNVFRFRSREY